MPLSFAMIGRDGMVATNMSAAIEVEKTHGPILLISAKDDCVWNSHSMCDAIENRLRSAHFAYPVVHLSYAHAGHIGGVPNLTPKWTRDVRNPNGGRVLRMGGTLEGNAESSMDAIPKVLDFLDHAIGTSAAAATH